MENSNLLSSGSYNPMQKLEASAEILIRSARIQNEKIPMGLNDVSSLMNSQSNI